MTFYRLNSNLFSSLLYKFWAREFKNIRQAALAWFNAISKVRILICGASLVDMVGG